MKLLRVAAALSFVASSAAAQPAAVPDWVNRSNQNATILLKVMARFAPEAASRFGVEGHDADVTTLPLDVNQKTIAATEVAIKELQAKLATEKDSAVRQD